MADRYGGGRYGDIFRLGLFGSYALVALVRRGDIARDDMHRLVYAAYVAGGLLFDAGAALMPFLSGSCYRVPAALGAMADLLLIREIVERNMPAESVAGSRLTMSRSWMLAVVVVVAPFITVIGPAITGDGGGRISFAISVR